MKVVFPADLFHSLWKNDKPWQTAKQNLPNARFCHVHVPSKLCALCAILITQTLPTHTIIFFPEIYRLSGAVEQKINLILPISSLQDLNIVGDIWHNSTTSIA